jgi:hypothetical protein
MRLLAIDPGTTKSGWVLIENIKPVQWGWDDNEEVMRLLDITKGILHDEVVIEDVAHYGMPVGRDVFETVRWTGRFDTATPMPVTYINRPEVKLTLCGNPRANDSTIRQALIDRFGGDDVAIGGKKCQTCKGKGWNGRGRLECGDCSATGYETAPGLLHGISGHVWSALAVGVTYLGQSHETT